MFRLVSILVLALLAPTEAKNRLTGAALVLDEGGAQEVHLTSAVLVSILEDLAILKFDRLNETTSDATSDAKLMVAAVDPPCLFADTGRIYYNSYSRQAFVCNGEGGWSPVTQEPIRGASCSNPVNIMES